MSSEAASTSAFERTWWLRAPAVLVAPRAVFVSLRDESQAATEARQEPLIPNGVTDVMPFVPVLVSR